MNCETCGSTHFAAHIDWHSGWHPVEHDYDRCYLNPLDFEMDAGETVTAVLKCRDCDTIRLLHDHEWEMM